MYTYDEISTSILVIVAALGAFILFANALKAWHELRRPEVDLRDTVDEHQRTIQSDHARIDDHETRIAYLEGCCEEVHGKLQCDWEFQQAEVEMNRLLLKSIKQLIKHSLDDNDINGLTAVEGEIDDYLIKHTN